MKALKQIIPVLIKRLGEKGLGVVDEDNLNKLLCKKRVRYTGYVSSELAREIGEEFKVKAILAGSIISFSRKGHPKIGISARLIDSYTGHILWADYASVTGTDFTTILGLGTITTINELIPKALDKLFASFSIVPPQKEIESTYMVAVMPFQNKSKFRNAGKIATYLFLVELLKNKNFVPIEYGDVRKLVVDLRIRSEGALDYKNIEAISEALGVGAILVGTVERYSSSGIPKVAITARLLDARINKILWYNSLQLSGEEGIIVFDWGRIRTVDRVAYKVVSELVEEIETAKLQ